MKLNTAIIATYCLIATNACADMPTDFIVHPKAPSAKIIKSEGIGSNFAKIEAKTGKAELEAWCDNWKPEDDHCLQQAMTEDQNTSYTASANCQSGQMTDPSGRKVLQSGLITEGEMFDGRLRFKDLTTGKFVGTDNADGGLTLATQWLTLCPYGLPYDVFPLSNTLPPTDGSESFAQTATHNGSSMVVDTIQGSISYAHPKYNSIEPGSILFRGSIVPDGPVIGMAYTFKKGCEPAPYYVEGNWNEYSGIIELNGAAPVRSKTDCAITGYSIKSPNAKLNFTLLE
jgi:hypothetical protein